MIDINSASLRSGSTAKIVKKQIIRGSNSMYKFDRKKKSEGPKGFDNSESGLN